MDSGPGVGVRLLTFGESRALGCGALVFRAIWVVL